MLRKFGCILGLISFGAGVGISPLATASESFPSEPLTAYIGFGAGGGTDTICRVVTRVMSEKLGQQINVINKTGSGGGIAAMTVMRAKPDGYSFLLSSSSSISSAPLINKHLKYGIDDFDYVATVAAYQPAVIAPINAPYDSLEEYVEYARKNPGTKYASLTPRSRMLMQYIIDHEKIDVNFLPAKGGSVILNLFAGNQVDIGYGGGFHQRYPEKIKILAVATGKRQAAHPDAKTLVELGYPIALNSQILIAVPKGTPAPVIAKLEATAKSAMDHPDVQAITAKLKYPPDYRNAAATSDEMVSQLKFYKNLSDFAEKK